MYHRAREFIRDRIEEVYLRIGETFHIAQLPPLATHLLCFVGGSLLFEADSSGKIPEDILIPWNKARIEGGLHADRHYGLFSVRGACALSPESVKLFKPEGQMIYVRVTRGKAATETIAMLQKSDTRLYRKDKNDKLPCRKPTENLTIFP